jgi:cell division protein FtsI/penicillin-binding protein 2
VGQDEVRASPLGIAAVLAAIATNGEAPRPRLDPGVATTRVRLATPLAAGRVRAALHEVVRVGTASRAFAENPYRERILGKTGSSQRVDAQGIPRTDSWFAGVVLPPEGVAEHPVVLVAVLPGAGLGGAHAARVVDGLSRALAAARGWSSGIEAPQG